MKRFKVNKVMVAKVFLVFFLVFFWAVSAQADVTLAWDANTEGDLKGYILYYKIGSSGPPYDETGLLDVNDQPVDSGYIILVEDLDDPNNPAKFLKNLTQDVQYYFTVTAIDLLDNESGYSNEVVYQETQSTTSDVPPPDISANESLSTSHSVVIDFSYEPHPDRASICLDYGAEIDNMTSTICPGLPDGVVLNGLPENSLTYVLGYSLDSFGLKGPPSPIITAMTKHSPPTGVFGVKLPPNKVNVYFDLVPGATSYRIEYNYSYNGTFPLNKTVAGPDFVYFPTAFPFFCRVVAIGPWGESEAGYIDPFPLF